MPDQTAANVTSLSSTPTIRVQGHGNVATEPDVVVLSLVIVAEDKDYARTIEELNTRSATLRNSVEDAGEDAKSLKTTSFTVTVNNDYHHGRYVFRGFNGTHALQLRLPFEQQRLAKLFSAITASLAKAQLSISFTATDPEAIRQRVVAAAVANARQRAQIIAAASQQRLGRLLNIEYGYTEVRISSGPFALEAPGAAAAAAPILEPAEIESEDTVRITWEILPDVFNAEV